MISTDEDLERLESASPSRATKLIAVLLDPAVVSVSTMFVVSLNSTTMVRALIWTLVAATFTAIIPYGIIWSMLGRGKVTDMHIVRRSQRHIPLMLSVFSVAAGLLICWVKAAPAELFNYVVSLLVGIVSMTLASRISKVSFHAGVSAGAAVVLATVFGLLGGLIGAVLATIAGWARVKGGRHSLRQVLLGSAIGVCSGLIFWFLM